MTSQPLRFLAALPITALALAGCADDSDNNDEPKTAGTISIVASTNVYGDIARAVAGDLASVRSIITSTAQDPHEYEASAQDRLALEKANIVIKNGGGYDSFIDTMLESTDNDSHVLDAVSISGRAPDDGGDEHRDDQVDKHDDAEAHEGEADHEDEEGHDHIEGFNEHVWYDFHTAEKLADELSHELGELDPDDAKKYASNAEAFGKKIEELEADAEHLRAAANGKGVAITEPLPVYLLDEVGLVNHTPEAFSEAVEEGADVPPRILQETLGLFTAEDIALLAYNAQTADDTTERVRAAAEAAGVPVVNFTETLPEGQSYVKWQQTNIANLAAALSKQ